MTERELLYRGLYWSVGVDGTFINQKQIPYTNCLYEIALAYDSKSKQLKRKEQECNKLYIQLKSDEEYHKEEENTLRKIIKNKKERNIELYKENNKLQQTLEEIKSLCYQQDLNEDFFACEVLQKINEVGK